MSTLQDSPSSFLRYLETSGVNFQVLRHSRDFCAQETAKDTHTPGRRFAKSVVIWADNAYALIVLPADRRIDLPALQRALDAAEVCFVHEEELKGLFPDCELGAEPPFGSLYGIPVFVDAHLANEDAIAFNAGTHEVAVSMSFTDFKRLTNATIIHCTVAPQ